MEFDPANGTVGELCCDPGCCRLGASYHGRISKAGRSHARAMLVEAAWAAAKAPARELIGIDDVGIATAFLAHDAARLITGQVLYVDGGYHIVD